MKSKIYFIENRDVVIVADKFIFSEPKRQAWKIPIWFVDSRYNYYGGTNLIDISFSCRASTECCRPFEITYLSKSGKSVKAFVDG